MTVVSIAAAAVAAVALAGGPASAATGQATTAACIRGHWYAAPAESHRVLQALAPGPYDVKGGSLRRVRTDGSCSTAQRQDAAHRRVRRIDDVRRRPLRVAGALPRTDAGEGEPLPPGAPSSPTRSSRQSRTVNASAFPGPARQPRDDSRRAVALPMHAQPSRAEDFPSFASMGWITFQKRRESKLRELSRRDSHPQLSQGFESRHRSDRLGVERRSAIPAEQLASARTTEPALRGKAQTVRGVLRIHRRRGRVSVGSVLRRKGDCNERRQPRGPGRPVERGALEDGRVRMDRVRRRSLWSSAAPSARRR